MLRHILIAVDGSEGAGRAVAFAARLLDHPSTELTLLVAVEPQVLVPMVPFDGFATTAQHPPPDQVRAAEALMTATAAQFGAHRVHSRVETGSPADVICRVADELDVDLIVVGARNLNPAARWLLGSVSDKVAHNAHRPVLLVP